MAILKQKMENVFIALLNVMVDLLVENANIKKMKMGKIQIILFAKDVLPLMIFI